MNCGNNQLMCWDIVKWDIVTDEDFNKGVIVRSQDVCELVGRCDSSKPSCPRVKNGFHIHTSCMPGKSRPKLVLKHCLSDGDGDRTSEILEERYSTRSDSDLMSGHLFLNWDDRLCRRSALKTSNAYLLGLYYHIKCGTPAKSRQDLISYPFALACMQVKHRHKCGPNNGQQAATDGPRRDVVQFSD